MAVKRGHEIATIDVALVTVEVPGETEELILDTSSQIQVTPQIETTDAVKLIIKAQLRAQKPQQNVLTGNTIVLTDNVFNPELVVLLQGGTILTDPDTGRLTGYDPPVAGSAEKGKVLTLNAYSAIYNTAGVITGYEKIIYPNCQGVPISLSAQDNVFRVSEYTINSAPEMGQAPYSIRWLLPDQIPVLPPQITELSPAITTSATLPNATANIPYNQILAATGTTPITWTIVSGSLPTGLTMSADGAISGTPTAVETATFVVQAANGILPNATKEFTLVVNS